MNNFFSLRNVKDLSELLKKGIATKNNPLANLELGKNKTLCLIFFNPSLRTRLSSQKAAYNLGMNVITMNVGADGWQLESEEGVVMDQGKAEHIRDAAQVVSQYSDLIGIRCFAGLKDKIEDYQEVVLRGFMKHASVPIINLESSTLHPLQSFADLITIETHKKKPKPKVVLTWAPHPRALPQAVANSFVEWMTEAEVDFVLTHPPGYELATKYRAKSAIEYDQEKAFEGADFIYAKNWSSYSNYGQIVPAAENWMVTKEKMDLTNQAKFMHCLPVRRNVVVTDEVMDSDHAIHIEQAANRVVSIQTIMQELLNK